MGFYLTSEYNALNGVGGSCYFCNASKRVLEEPEKIVTTDLVGDMMDAPDGVWPERWVEVCEQCVTEMGRMVGMASEYEVQEATLEKINLEVELEQTRKELSEAREALKAYQVVKSYEVPDAAPVEPKVASRRK